MVNTTEQMQQVFGFTPEGLDQEVKKYKPKPSKGLGYGELIVDNILGLDNEYESFGEKLGKAINEDEIKFLKDASVGIYEGAKEFIKAPVETTKQIVGEIKNSVTRLGSEDLNTRLQRMFKVSYEQATDEQINQAREAVLGDALTALELIPAAAVTTSAAKVGIGAIPSGFKADAMGTYRSLASGDPKEIKEQMSYLMTPTSKQPKPKGVGANVPGMFPKNVGLDDIEDVVDYDPDRVKQDIEQLFKTVDINKKYGIGEAGDLANQPMLTAEEVFLGTDELNLRSLNVNPYRPLLEDVIDDPNFEFDESMSTEAFDTITRDLRTFADERSSYNTPILRNPDLNLEDVPTFTDDQMNNINLGIIDNSFRDMGVDKITYTTLSDVVTTDYFDQVQAELLSSIDKKIKDAIPKLPIENLARLVGLSNSDTLLSERTRNSLDEVSNLSQDLIDVELKSFIMDSGILAGHYVSDPRNYRRVTKNPTNDPTAVVLDETSFTADLTPRTNRIDGLTGRTVYETDPGKVINGSRKYKFEAVFGSPMETPAVGLFDVNNNNSFIINGIKQSLKNYFKTLDLNKKTAQGDTLGEVSKAITEDYVRQKSIAKINPSNRITELENIGKIALIELGRSIGDKPIKGARIYDALDKDPRISNKNIPDYFKSSEFKGKTFNSSELEDLADKYSKESPIITYPPDTYKPEFDVIQRQDLNHNPAAGKFAGGNVIDTFQSEILAEAGPTNRVPAFTISSRPHYDERGLGHVRYTEMEPIDVTDQSAIRETYPELEYRDLDTDFAQGLENFEDIINYENYFLVDEIQSDLISKGFDEFKAIPYTKEIIKNALEKKYLTDKEYKERQKTGLAPVNKSNESFIEEYAKGLDLEPYKDEMFEKITELLDLYHNKGGSSLSLTDTNSSAKAMDKLQSDFIDDVIKREKKLFFNLSPGEQSDKIKRATEDMDLDSVITDSSDYGAVDDYFLTFEVKLRGLLNESTQSKHYDKSQIGEGGIKGLRKQVIVNRKATENPDSYKKPPITNTEEAVQQAIQRLIFDASERGVNKIVIPNFDRIASNQRYEREQLFYALQNKSYNQKTGKVTDGQALYKTYVSALEKVLPKFEEAYGLTVHKDVTLPYVKDGISDFSKRSDVPLRKDKEFLKGDPIRFSDKGIIIDITDMKEDFDLSQPAFAEGGILMRPEPRPETRPFPDVRPQERPEQGQEKKSEIISKGFEIDGQEVEVPIIKFKDGEEIAFDAAIQKIRDRGTANEPTVGKATERQILNFLREKNPTREEFETYWYNKRLNKGGAMMNEQMQMAFMNEGGLTDDGMNKDPVSGNDVPSGSLAEEVRDNIPAQLSEGEYVVPADVVRYYGVKFFEDLRDQAKMGLAEMEADGRIGGEPVPAGGPTNTDELSPQETQAIQEMMGMAEGGEVQNPYMQQQLLYSQPRPVSMDEQNKAIVASMNPVQNQMPTQNMAVGGQVQGYQNSSVVTPTNIPAVPAVDNTGQNYVQAGQQALNKGFTGFPLGSTIFPSEKTGQTVLQTASTDTSAPITVTLYGQIVTLNLPADINRYNELLSKGYTTEMPVAPSSGGGGGGGGGGDDPPEPPDPNAWAEGLDAKNSMDWVQSNLSGEKVGDGFVNNIKLAQNYARSAALANIAEAQGNKDLANQIRGEMAKVYKNSQFIRMMPGEFIDGSSIGAKLEGKIDLSGKTTTPDPLAAYRQKDPKTVNTKQSAVKSGYEKKKKKKDGGYSITGVTPGGGTSQSQTFDVSAEDAAEIDKSAAAIDKDDADSFEDLNKGGLMTKGKKK